LKGLKQRYAPLRRSLQELLNIMQCDTIKVILS